jgi:hypothetical protein
MEKCYTQHKNKNIKRITLGKLMPNVSSLPSKFLNFNKLQKVIACCIIILFSGANLAHSQISTLNEWTNFYHGTGNSSASYSVPTGSNSHRILVVAVSTTATATTTRSITLSYGGQNLTPVNGDLGSSTRQHTQFYYLDEEGLDAAGTSTTLAFTVSDGTTANNDVFASVYDYVDQTSPITNSQVYNSGTGTTSTISFGTALTVNAYDLALKVVSSVRTGNRSARTINDFGTNWISNFQVTSSYNPGGSSNDLGIRNAIGTRAIPTTNTTDASTVTLDAATLASMTGISLKEAKSITTGTISGSPFCAGSSVSVPYTIMGTFVSGNIFTAQLSNASGSFASPVTIGTLASTASGTISATIPAGTVTGTGYRIRVVSGNPVVTGTDNGINLTINATPAVPAATDGLICIGSTATLSASGAVSGQRYVWYSAASGGTTLKTSTDNNDNTFTTPVLGATTNYWVSILNTSGCESTRTIVTATFPAVSTDNQNDAGTNSWIGHVYDGTAFNTYYGHYTETETFDQSFGGATNCFSFTSNSETRNILTTTFSVRYRMNSTKKGLYVVDLGSDDGGRMTVDGTLLYNNWSDQAFSSRPRILMGLTGTSSLIYDFNENGGENRVVFQNLTLVLANNLNANTSQSISVGSSGTAISGDAFGSLPTGITLSGTGYQWTYSTTPGGARTNITGATSATYTPNASVAPFNSAGTYYIYRNAVLSSANNTGVNPYIATSESNVATLVVNAPLITVNPTTLTGFNYIVGNGPSSQQSFTVSGAYLANNITITPSTNYEISITSGSGFQSTPITLTQTGGTVATTTIYVRLKAGLTAGNYNPENIVSSSTGAVTKNVTCSGTVNTPTIITSVTSLSEFSYPVGNGPSAQQSFTVGGNYLTANITVTPSTNYEISTISGSGFQTTPISLTQSGGTVATTTIYVRLKAGLSAGNYNSENIVSTSTGAVSKNVTCSGTVGSPSIITSTASLTGFSYSLGSGPSAEQSFTVSATFLSANLTVTPSANFEISTTSGSGFQPAPISLTQTGGTVPTTTIYVRLKSGLSVGSYNSENIASSSTGATTQNVAVSGSVYAAYCTSSGNLSYQTRTTLVNFNTISNSTPGTKTIGYSDFTSISTNLIKGSIYPLTVNLNTDGNYTVYARVWIDWNSDGDFDDAGENYDLGSAINQTNGATSLSPLNITIPESAVTGTIRMRVSCKYNTYPTACESAFDGEVEDYSLNIAARSITTGTIQGSPFLAGSEVSVPYTISGSFTTGNIFTAQLSNASGSFASPTSIGTLTSVSAGTIPATIPSITLSGTGYRIRVVSSSPVVTGSDNGSNLTVTGGAPSITVTPSSITTFSYPEGSGPSAIESFTVSGANLIANIIITPSEKFEISTVGGAGFSTASIITLPVSGGAVANTTIYVRMKAGLATGNHGPENIVATSTDATTKTVACSGTVLTAPNITVSAISGTFSYIFGSGPSAQQSFTVSGTNLLGNVIITPPTNYEISTTSGSGFISTPITLTQSGGTLTTTTIYVRLKTALGTGSYSENVVASSTSAVSKNVALSGTVTASATIYNTISFLSGFIYSGTGPSGIQSFVVKATALTGNVTATPPTNFEISKDGINFQLTALTLNRVGTTLATDTIVYVRMKSGLAVGDYGPLNSSVVLTSSGAITKSVACKGKVVNTRTLLVSKTTLTGFGYEYSESPAGGPSSPQSFTVSGALLGGNIAITAPANYEISQNSTSGYTSSISLTGTTVNPTLIYVRLKSGLVAADYGTLASPLNLPVATTGVTTINVACIGKVFASPLISASGGGEFCEGSTINLSSEGSDIQSRYWTGPNSFYSTLQSPALTTNATQNLSGTYTVNGNVIVGGNLITNGDFEAGNTSFSSGYGYVAPSSSALNPEGLYTIVNLPSAVHSDFTNHPDHTTGTGLQMVVNGSPTAGVVVWSQSVPVIPGATYQFTYWEQTVNITQVPKNASQLQLYVNGVAAGPVYTAPEVNYVWAPFLYNASAGSNTVLNLELINQNTVASGNDFALDDIVFQQVLPASSSTDVTVSPILPVSVEVVASANPVYMNTPVTFTATPANGGTAPSYQWKVNGINAGTDSPTYIYTPQDGDIVSCTLTSSLTCVTNNPATNSVVMTVTLRDNYWMGYLDTDWGKTGNWTADYIPLTGDDVEYATVANFGSSAIRDLHLDINRTIGSLINATTKRLVIPAGKGLTVNNTITTDGNADRIYIYSSPDIANGSLSFKNIDSMPVSATVEMYSRAWWNLADTINNRYRWQYFGIPVRSVKAEPTFNGSYVRKWDETGTTIQNHWVQLTNESVLQPFLGYEICQESAKKVYFKGQLVNSDFNSGQLAITETALYPGQHIFANPYTAAIDIKQLTFGTNTESSVYLYNTGTFSIWEIDKGFSTSSNEGQYMVVPKDRAGQIGIPRQVPSMQAMLVKAKDFSDATFNINYNAVIMNNNERQRIQIDESISNTVGTKIDVAGKNFSDKMWIFSEPGCTRYFDDGWDGFKLPGNALTPQIFAIEPDGNYQVNSVDNMNNTVLGFQAGNDTDYTMTFTHKNIKNHYQGLYLIDLIEDKTIDITGTGTEYKFSAVSTPKPVSRFKIVTRPYEKDAPDMNSEIKIFNWGKTIFVHNLSNLDGEFIIFDISGRRIKKATFGANSITTMNTNYISGGYIVFAKTRLEEVSKRIIIRN